MSILFAVKSNAQAYLEFVENKGQWANNIAFKGDLSSGAIALKSDGGYRMLQHNQEDLEAIHNFYHPHETKKTFAEKSITKKELGLHSHVYEVSFLGCNPNPTAISEKPQDTYNNYYLDNDKSKWASGCKIYQAVTYKNIYPNIDIRYYTGNGTLKYDLIVNPGGNPNQIAMVFDGADELKIKKGKLEIKTSVTTVNELEPYTFQPSAIGKKQINCSYKLNQNIVTFSVDNYDKSQPLIIDPAIKVFSTFTGSVSDNWGFTATYDGAGNFYAGGVVFSGGFPVSNGSTFQGGVDSEDGNKFDMGIIKFNPLGTNRLYATYIGGSNGNDQPHSLVVDGFGNLIIAGRTNATNYPTTLPNNGICGAKDIVLTKLNNAGNIMASMKVGGSGDDGMNIKPKYSSRLPVGTESINRNYGDDARSEVIVDENNNILLASCTQSLDFYVTPNAFQKTNGGAAVAFPRKQDGVFIKATNDLSNVLTSTYIGGNNDDAAFVLAINPLNKNIYLAGGTASTDFPGNKTSVLNPSYLGGECDGFVAILNSTGTSLLASSYFGTSRAENIYGIQFDKVGFPYIMGTTTGAWPILNAAENTPFAKQFIAKLQSNLSNYVYSTTFGTPNPQPNISPTAFLVDRCENVYVSGWGGSINTGNNTNYLNAGTSGLKVKPLDATQNVLQTTTDGSDFYFYVLERGAKSQIFGGFFGQIGGVGEHVDGGTSRFDNQGVIYQSLCANCGSNPKPNFPTTPGAYSQNNLSDNCNLAAIKIAFDFAGVGAGVRSSIKGVNGDTSGCVPLTIKFQDTLAQGISYTWNFGDGSPTITTKTPNISYTYNSTGKFLVKLVSIDSSTCNIIDSSKRIMIIRSDSASLKLTYKKVGDCYANTYEFDNTGSIAAPSKPFKNNSFLINYGDGVIENIGLGVRLHKYNASGFYKGFMVLQDTNYCNSPDTVFFNLTVIDNLKASFTRPGTGCLSAALKFTNTSNGGDTYLWDFGEGNFAYTRNASHFFSPSGNYWVKLTVYDSFSCNKVSKDSFLVNIAPSPTAFFTYNPNPPKINTPVNFINKSERALRYVWIFGDGDSLFTNSLTQSIVHTYQLTQIVTPTLIVYNEFNCTDTFRVQFRARVNQLFDVPNAIAPDGNTNNKIFVRGYGIKKINWNIYNRWGILMYSSNDVTQGWDGKYKGQIQPQDVYHYTLLVDFFDGKKDSKTGDITLVR